MSQTLGEASAPSWEERRQRAAELLSNRSHAEQILGFYLQLVDLQEALYLQVLASESLPHPESPGEVETLGGFLQRIPPSQLNPGFSAFVAGVTNVGTAVVADIGRSLLTAGEESLYRLLDAFLAEEPLDPVASALECDPRQLVFFPRAFIQPIAEAAAEQDPKTVKQGRENLCPRCQRAPQVACIRDDAEVRGRNLLVCSLCATRWPFPRSTCPNCFKAGPKVLVFHRSEACVHVRVAECRNCRGYLKSVDLRECATAVPLVEDLATVELDLWSADRGLWKIQPNLLGF